MIPPLDERTADDSRVNMNSAFEMTKADIPWSDVLLPATPGCQRNVTRFLHLVLVIGMRMHSRGPLRKGDVLYTLNCSAASFCFHLLSDSHRMQANQVASVKRWKS